MQYVSLIICVYDQIHVVSSYKYIIINIIIRYNSNLSYLIKYIKFINHK